MPGRTAAQQLGEAVAALTRGVAAAADAQAPAYGAAAPQGTAHAGPQQRTADTSLPAAPAQGRAADAQDGLMDVRPRLLMVAYYTQRVGSPPEVHSSTFATLC